MNTPTDTSTAYRILCSIGKWIFTIVVYILIALTIIALALYIGGLTHSTAVTGAFLIFCIYLGTRFAKR